MIGKDQTPDIGKKTQFEPGKSGNPAGKPRKLPKLDILLDEVLGEEKDDVTAAQQILMRLRQLAINGRGTESIRAAEVLLDRGYGKAKQYIEGKITGDVNLLFEKKPRQRAEPEKIDIEEEGRIAATPEPEGESDK